MMFGATALVPLMATAQPAPPPPPPGDGSAAGGLGGAGLVVNGQVDEAKLKEMVDREIARVLTERAAKEAADKAAKELEAKETPAAPSKDGPSEITGSSGFFDTRLAFTLTNENLLVKPGETIPSVPGWRFGTPNSLGVLFFDNYDTRFSGFETLSHAVMYRNFTKGHLQAEAAFVLRINELSERTIDLSDAGSYIVLSNWKDPTHKDPTRISLTAFPVSADRFRLGYSYRLSYGGNPEYGRTKSATPGVKVQYDTDKFYAFAGAKSAIVLDRRTAEQKAALAFLAGAGVDLSDLIRVEANGGYFDRGYNELQDVNDQKVQLFGGSLQVSLHKNMPLRSSVDFRLYKNNNEKVSDLFKPESYPGGLAWLAQAEFTTIGQTLKDPAPDKTGSTKIQMGTAGDLNVRVKLDRVRIRADISYRDLAFILHSQPSLPTYSDFPTDYKTEPNLFAAVGVDRNWNDWLTLGVIVGVDKPATLTSPKGLAGGATDATESSTAVIRNNNIDTLITILPAGEKAVPQFAGKGTAKVDFGKMYTALAEVFYSYDGNATRYRREDPNDPTSAFKYEFGQFSQLGVNVTLQARF
ncbi:MAG: hypothetical protein H0T79_23110 [Deltaproteobacteria bacterium]|nr:hypothetical protein [Deltaproteobacteria bacterium]